MVIKTRVFGEIEIDDNKIITFSNGIIGFPDLKKFTLLYDAEKTGGIKWLQSLDEPAFAMPVMDPSLVMEDYTPMFDRDLLKPLGGNLDPENLMMLVTVTVPKYITQTTVNLKAPIIVNVEERKAVQLISDDDTYSIKYAIYNKIKAKKAGE